MYLLGLCACFTLVVIIVVNQSKNSETGFNFLDGYPTFRTEDLINKHFKSQISLVEKHLKTPIHISISDQVVGVMLISVAAITAAYSNVLARVLKSIDYS